MAPFHARPSAVRPRRDRGPPGRLKHPRPAMRLGIGKRGRGLPWRAPHPRPTCCSRLGACPFVTAPNRRKYVRRHQLEGMAQRTKLASGMLQGLTARGGAAGCLGDRLLAQSLSRHIRGLRVPPHRLMPVRFRAVGSEHSAPSSTVPQSPKARCSRGPSPHHSRSKGPASRNSPTHMQGAAAPSQRVCQP